MRAWKGQYVLSAGDGCAGLLSIQCNEFKHRCRGGVDGTVNTIYSAPPLLTEHNLSSKSSIVKSRHVIRTSRPMKGLVAFVRAAAMGLSGACDATLHQVYPMSCRFDQSLGGWQLDRNEDRMHPGEGSA